jgi:hypothetical protein
MNFPNFADHPERGVAIFAFVVWMATIGRAVLITYGL